MLGIAVALLSSAFDGPGAQEMPLRPRLDAAADTNDWEVYFDHGLERLDRDRSEASAAFYWASRLDPTRAEPLFARWAIFWIKDLKRFVKYLREDKATLEARDVHIADSLRMWAFRRNPFVHQGLLMAIYARLPGGYSGDIVTTALFAYARADFVTAVDRFGVAIAKNPKRNAYLRFVRAAAFVGMKQKDSAVAELSQLLTYLRAAEQGEFVPFYNSKELLEYAVGRVHAERLDFAEASNAFGRALAENASFAPAHYALGAMAQVRKDWEKALLEYSLAVELDPGEVEARLAYAKALYYERRPAEGINQVKEAIALEPFYAESYLILGALYDSVDDVKGARAAYEQYLALAPKKGAVGIKKAQARLKELGVGN